MNRETRTDTQTRPCRTDSSWEAATSHRELSLLLWEDQRPRGVDWGVEDGESEAELPSLRTFLTGSFLWPPSHVPWLLAPLIAFHALLSGTSRPGHCPCH